MTNIKFIARHANSINLYSPKIKFDATKLLRLTDTLYYICTGYFNLKHKFKLFMQRFLINICYNYRTLL